MGERSQGLLDSSVYGRMMVYMRQIDAPGPDAPARLDAAELAVYLLGGF